MFGKISKLFLVLGVILFIQCICGCDNNHIHYCKIYSTSSSHYLKCDCGFVKETSDHVFEWKVDKYPTKEENGLKHEECEVCGYKQSENTQINKIEGGETGRVRGFYEFETYDEFLNFYLIFIEHNEQRYLFPTNNSENICFEYSFLSEGVLLSDYEQKKYDICFPNPTCYLNVFSNEFEATGVLVDISKLNIKTPLDFKFQISEIDSKNHFAVFANDLLIYDATIIFKTNNENLDFIFSEILNEFTKGGSYYD